MRHVVGTAPNEQSGLHVSCLLHVLTDKNGMHSQNVPAVMGNSLAVSACFREQMLTTVTSSFSVLWL